jgi:predicted DNA-binding ribbon-helix-helix protein
MKKRSVLVAGHPTSVSLEEEFWDGLKDVARSRGLSVNAMIEEIDAVRSSNLSSAIRVYVLKEAQRRQHTRTSAQMESDPPHP